MSKKPNANTYAGIDYGLGKANVDKETGIRYGVISQHSVGQAWYDSAEPEYGKPHCPKCGEVARSIDTDDDGNDYTCDDCKESFQADECFPDEAMGWSFEDSEYALTDCLDSDIFVLKSPYFTYAQYCSPCVPGACNLNSPIDAPFDTCTCVKPVHDGDCAYAGVPRCYALGHQWFEGDQAPYRVFRVVDGVEMVSEAVEVSCETCMGTGRRTAEAYMNLNPYLHGFKGDNGELLHVGDTFRCNLCSGTGKRTEQQVHAVEVSS